jgi:hypothetical protein
METIEAVLIVICPKDSVEPLVLLSNEHGAEVQISDRRNLDGEILSSCLVIISVIIRTAPAFLRSLTEFLQRNQIERIECDGVVIDKPRPEDVDAIKAHLLRDRKGKSRT